MKVKDGLLMVVAERSYGKKVEALLDSVATRCFVSSACVTACGLKGAPPDAFLELGNGETSVPGGEHS